MKRVSLFLLLIISLAVTAVYAEDTVLNIVYTGSLQGELEPCGCSPKTDFGGVARLSGYLDAHKKELSPYLLVDAGNFSGDDTPQGRLKTEALLKAFGIMGYDAVALGKREKIVQDLVLEVSRSGGIRLISESEHDSTVSAERGSLDISISTDAAQHKAGKINVLLTDMAVTAAQTLKQWDVIVLSSGENLDEPLRADGGIIVSGHPKGKEVGILSLYLDDTGKIKKYAHRWQPLGNDISENRAVRQVLNDYDARVTQLYREAEKSVSETDYLGAASCAECHQPFTEVWQKTRHAGAFASLERVNKASDPECIECHVVGFGEAGGFYSMNSTPGLANVQCEACHGPGKKHLADLDLPLGAVTVSVCLRCHTKDNSPEFNYPAYAEKIKHW